MSRWDIIAARHSDPSGAVCGHCGRTNDLADDLGWFYLSVPSVLYSRTAHLPLMKRFVTYPACSTCMNGEPGRLHRKHWGLGER